MSMDSSSLKFKQRIFGSTENALVDISLQHRGYLKVGTILLLQGPHISVEELQIAVRCLQQRHPFLRSRLKHNPNDLNTYLMEEDSELQLKIREIFRKREDHLHFWQQEWQEHEKDLPVIGEALVEFWLLQDPNDFENDNGPREIVIICEHSICDGISISVLAHELLLALGENDKSLFDQSLDWPLTLEEAVQRTLAVSNPPTSNTSESQPNVTPSIITRIPLSSVDFSLDHMAKYCHTEASYGFLTREETQKLFEKCRQENVTLTSAIGSAVLCGCSTVANDEDNQSAQLTLSVATDVRRRCIPPIPNHDLSYYISGIKPFAMLYSETPTTVKGMWDLARTFGQHVKMLIDKGQVVAVGAVMGMLYRSSMGPVNLVAAPTCGISNWGLLPFQECYGKWKLTTVLPIVNLIRVVLPMILVQTVNGVLIIGYFGPAPLLSPTILKNLRDHTIQYLRQMMGVI